MSKSYKDRKNYEKKQSENPEKPLKTIRDRKYKTHVNDIYNPLEREIDEAISNSKYGLYNNFTDCDDDFDSDINNQLC